MEEGKKGRAAWEWVVFLVVIVFAVALVGSTYSSQQKLEQQKELNSQLQLLRTAAMLYKTINKSNAPSIQLLVEGTFRLPEDMKTHHYIENPPKLTNGKLLDPFGNPYIYDPARGWVKSTTPGYEYW